MPFKIQTILKRFNTLKFCLFVSTATHESRGYFIFVLQFPMSNLVPCPNYEIHIDDTCRDTKQLYESARQM